MADVYINSISAFLPNDPVSNEEMESYLGFIGGEKSKSKRVVLRSNKIEQRYYALDNEGRATHTNAEMVAEAVRRLFSNPREMEDVELLACGTTSPDALLPSHAVLVHGLLPELAGVEVISNAGACCSGMQSFKHAYLSVKAEDKSKAVCTGSERMSSHMRATFFEEEIKYLERIEANPYVAFEKDFLRWMLSDGAGAFLVEAEKKGDGPSLKVEWIEMCSFANELETCMYMGAEKDASGKLVGYQDMSIQEVVQNSVLSIKQDVKLLSENIVSKGFAFLKQLLEKKNIDVRKVDYFLPHMSSHFFQDKIYAFLKDNGIEIPYDKWFVNLKTKGNIGAGSIYVMLEELLHSGQLKEGQQILLAVPESARFSYAFCLLTVKY